jgi:hypothetical protein
VGGKGIRRRRRSDASDIESKRSRGRSCIALAGEEST